MFAWRFINDAARKITRLKNKLTNKAGKMKILTIICLLFITGLTIFGQTDNKSTTTQTTTGTTTYVRPEAKERFKKYVDRAIGPTAFIGPAFSATFRQIRNSPEEWEKTSTGFARRFGDSVGRNIIKQTITYGLDEAFKLDSNYYKSQKKDFKSKFSNAVISSFTARNSQGKRVVGVPTIVGTYSSAIIANETWMPKRFNYKDGLRAGSISMVTRVGFNLLKEFVFK